MWKVLKRVINRKGKCNLVHKITVKDTEITNKGLVIKYRGGGGGGKICFSGDGLLLTLP